MRKIHISYPFILLSAALLALDSEGFLLMIWASVLVHETGHLAAIWLMRGSVGGIYVRIGGLRIDYVGEKQTSYAQDALAAAAGPAANAALALAAALISHRAPGRNIYLLAGINVIIALFNLLPIMPMDGGRIIMALASRGLGEARGLAVVQALTGAAGALVTAAGLWLLLESGGRSFMLLVTGVAALAESFGKGHGVMWPARPM